jgi:putative ABC transport system permease protein
MENILLDIRYALGRFVSQPIITLVIVLTLALGIGATSAIFSVVNGLMLQATPFKDSEKLVMLTQSQTDSSQSFGFSAPDVVDLQEQNSTFEELAEYHNMDFTMFIDDKPIRVSTGVVSSNYFSMLGITPHLGRFFSEEEGEIGAEPLIMLTYEFWKKEFGSDPDVINSSIEMNNSSHKIIGVLPHFPQFPNVNDTFITISSCPWRSSEAAITTRSQRWLNLYGKVKADHSIAQATDDLKTISNRLVASYPETYPTPAGLAANALSLNEELIKGNRPYLITLLSTTVLLFFIACANVTNLTLSQHAKRHREFAVRASLGASKMRLAQLLLTESLLLSLIAGVLGLLIAYVGLDFLKSFASNFSNLASEIKLDGVVMAFAMVISLLAGIISGLAPSFAKVDLVLALKEGGKSSLTTNNAGTRNFLLICQFALSMSLLIAAGLTIKSLNKLQDVDGGYSIDNVEVVQMDMNWSLYGPGKVQELRQFSQSLLYEVQQLPYISSASLAMTYPADAVAATMGVMRQALQYDDRDYQPDNILANLYRRPISYGYMETINARLLEGRFFDKNDDQNAPTVTVINKSFADAIWPNESAINHRISTDKGQTWFIIVGVVDDILERSLSAPADFQLYVSTLQAPIRHIAVVANVGSGVYAKQNYQADIKRIVAEIDSKQPLLKMESIQQAIDNSLSLQDFLAKLLTIFSLFALLITISGVSGVMGYMVNLRTREIGIRMAIGADKSTVIKLILGYGLKLTVIGLVVGLGCAYWAGSLLAEHLFEASSFDARVYGAALLVLFACSVITCLIPAFRASSVSPVNALKSN